MPLIILSPPFAPLPPACSRGVVPETSWAGVSSGKRVSVLVLREGLFEVVLFDRTSVDPFIRSSSLNEGEAPTAAAPARSGQPDGRDSNLRSTDRSVGATYRQELSAPHQVVGC